MEPILILKHTDGGLVSEQGIFGEPIADTVKIGRGLESARPAKPRDLTPQEVVNGLKFLREQVFSEENIEQIKKFLEHIEDFSTTIISVWNAISTYITDRRDNAGGMRSLDLMVALHQEGLTDLYDLIEQIDQEE